MSKPTSIVGIVVSIVAVCFIALLAFVSLLGENKKIDALIINYFNHVKDQKYVEVRENFYSEEFAGNFTDNEQIYNFNFLLEYTLQKKYDLINKRNYRVTIKKSHFWIPYFGKDTVLVGIALISTEKSGVIDVISGGNKEITNNLFVISRVKGTWKVVGINVADSSMASLYDDVKTNLDIDKYVKRSESGLVLNQISIDPQKLTPTDKKLLKFSMKKISDLLDNPDSI